MRLLHRSIFGLGWKRVLIGGAIMIAIPIAILTAAGAYAMHETSQPSFCGKCHVMEPYIAAWKASPHAQTNCESCHIPPGGAAFIGGKIAAMQVVIDFWQGNYDVDRSFSAVVPNSSCLRCHESILKGTITTPAGLKVSHSGIVRLGEKCMTCH